MENIRKGAKKIEYACASIQGDFHKSHGIENQDSFIFLRKPKYTIMSIADGVGSHTFAAEGSRAAVSSAAYAMTAYADGKISYKKIVETICSQYRSTIKKGHESLVGTTCIFVAVIYNKEILIGKIGDGMCVVKVNGEDVYISNTENDFANVVNALSFESVPAEWDTCHIALQYGEKVEVFMATDGIVGDVIPGMESRCAAYFLQKTDGKNREEANTVLQDMLIRWGQDGSADDKTVIVYKERD